MPKRKTHNQFIAELNAIAPTIKVLDNYINSNTKINFECTVCGYQWSSTPSNIISNSRECPKCAITKRSVSQRKTNEQFIEELKSVNPNIIVLGKYVTTNTKIECKCAVCEYQWLAAPKDLLHKHGCPKCAFKKQAVAQSKPYDEFISELTKINPKIQVIGNYVNSKTKIECKCLICDYIWNVRPQELLKGKGCPNCANNIRKTNEEFLEELKQINNNIHIIGRYINNKTKIKCECLICGHQWSPTPNALLHGAGCPKCANNLPLTHKEFIERLKKDKPDITVISNYINNHTKVECKCNICGHHWSPKPNSLLQQGSGCPNCNHTNTSYGEQFMYLLLCKALNNNVLSRDKKAIGKELDIYISDYKIAIEYGSWIWHKNRLKADFEKYKICKDKNIELITIIDSVKEDKQIEFAKTYNYLLQENDFLDIVYDVLNKCKVHYTFSDSEISEVKKNAYVLSRRKTTKQFSDELRKINSQIKILSDYENSTSKIKCECLVCGNRWDTTPSILLDGHGCPKCKSNKQAELFGKGHDEFIEELKQVNPQIKILGEYINNKTKIECECLICGHIWNAKPETLINNHGCPKCANNIKFTQEEFIEKLHNINPNIQVLGEYIKSGSKIKCTCSVCGHIWSPQANSLLQGVGCPKCAGLAKKTTSEFIGEMKQINPTIKIIGEYINNRTNIDCECTICGYKWSANPRCLLRGSKCKKCSNKQKEI